MVAEDGVTLGLGPGSPKAMRTLALERPHRPAREAASGCVCMHSHKDTQLLSLSQRIQIPRHQELSVRSLGVSDFSLKSLSGPILCYVCPFGKGHLELREVGFGGRKPESALFSCAGLCVLRPPPAH